VRLVGRDEFLSPAASAKRARENFMATKNIFDLQPDHRPGGHRLVPVDAIFFPEGAKTPSPNGLIPAVEWCGRVESKPTLQSQPCLEPRWSSFPVWSRSQFLRPNHQKNTAPNKIAGNE
jgi:hypothetical protein